jgi:hypothetical protein
MKSGQFWLLVSCIGIGAVFGAARGNTEKEAFLSQPLREACKLERCITSKPVASQRLLER